MPCIVVRVDPAKGPAIDAIPLTDREVSGKAVLLHTGWDRLWRTAAYFGSHPHLTERAAERLAKAGAALVGIDSMNIDSIATGLRRSFERLGVAVSSRIFDRLPSKTAPAFNSLMAGGPRIGAR